MSDAQRDRVFVTLPPDDVEQLRLFALEQGDSVAGLCRRVLVAYVRRKRAEKRAAANGSQWQPMAATRTERKRGA